MSEGDVTVAPVQTNQENVEAKPENEAVEEESKVEALPKKVKKKEEVKQIEVVKEQSEVINAKGEHDDSSASKSALFDLPLEISGKRDRKKVERFVNVAIADHKKSEIKADGSGVAFGEIEFIEAMISRNHPEDLKVLHRIAFGRAGSGSEIRRNLRLFNGFPFGKDHVDYEKKMSLIERLVSNEIKRALAILGLERGGTKLETAQRLLDFMVKPEDMKKKVPLAKSKRKKSGGSGGKRGRPRSKGDSTASKDNSTASKDKDKDAEEGGTTDSGAGGSSDGGEESADEERKETKKEAQKETKKKEVKKTVKKPPKKEEKKKEEYSSSDDEPLVKKSKAPPTNAEIKALVRKILTGANLEEITMKNVCRQVADKYPKFDLTDRKDFIKDTVKAMIS